VKPGEKKGQNEKLGLKMCYRSKMHFGNIARLNLTQYALTATLEACFVV